MFGDSYSHPACVLEHQFQLRNRLLATFVPIVSVGAVKHVDVVVLLQALPGYDLVDEPVGTENLRTTSDSGVVIGVEVRHLPGLGVMQDEACFCLSSVLVEQPAV